MKVVLEYEGILYVFVNKSVECHTCAANCKSLCRDQCEEQGRNALCHRFAEDNTVRGHFKLC